MSLVLRGSPDRLRRIDTENEHSRQKENPGKQYGNEADDTEPADDGSRNRTSENTGAQDNISEAIHPVAAETGTIHPAATEIRAVRTAAAETGAVRRAATETRTLRPETAATRATRPETPETKEVQPETVETEAAEDRTAHPETPEIPAAARTGTGVFSPETAAAETGTAAASPA